MLKLNQIDWGHPTKIKSREETIINKYKQLFGCFLPTEKTYWSMSGQCFSGGIVEGSEYDQIIKSGLVKCEQFNGVEINPDIHSLNCKIMGPNWHCGRFVDVIEENIESNPGIVRHDDTMMPQNCADDFSELIDVLTHGDVHEVLVLFTVAIKARGHEVPLSDITEQLSTRPMFVNSFVNGGWNLDPECYIYTSNVASTEMATVCIWR